MHTKRAVLYSGVFLATKIIIIGTALLIPARVFVSPDVLADQEKTLIELTNTFRTFAGVETLFEDDRLHRSAGLKTQDMADQAYFGHINPDGDGLDRFLLEVGYDYDAAGENLAMGFDVPEEMFAAWLASPTHYDNIVDPQYLDIGVSVRGGIYNGEPVLFAATHFGAPHAASSPATIKSINDVFAGQIYELDSARRAVVRFESPDASVAVIPDKDGATLEARAKIFGSVADATVRLGEESISLSPEAGLFDTYTGSAHIDSHSYGMLRKGVLPSIRIVGTDGDSVQAVLPWRDSPAPQSSVVRSYRRAKAALADAPLFSVSTYLYLGAALFFVLALLVSVFVRMHRQHPHIIAQTLCLILFFLTLALV